MPINLIDNIINVVFVSRDGVGRKDYRIPFFKPDIAVIIVSNSVECRPQLSLGTRYHQELLGGRKLT